jgi:hypothetical protein
MIRCPIVRDSGTAPSTSPGPTSSPAVTAGVNGHSFAAGRGDAPLDEGAALPGQIRQWPLQPIVNRAQQARPQVSHQRHARLLHRLANADARRILVNLDGRDCSAAGAGAGQANHLADQAQVADAHHIEETHVRQTLSFDDRPGDACNPARLAAVAGHPPFPCISSPLKVM